MELIALNPEGFKKVKGKVRTKRQLIEEIQGRCDGTSEKKETQPYTNVVDQATGETQWVYELRYGNQVLKLWKVMPHRLDDEGNLDISDEEEATFRQAVKTDIPKYARQIWKQKIAFAKRNRQNALKSKGKDLVALGGA